MPAAETPSSPSHPAPEAKKPAAQTAKAADTGRAAQPKAQTKRRVVGYPFRGKVGATDTNKWTLTVVTKNTKRVLPVSRRAKIIRNGKPVKLSDGKVGEEVAGYIRKLDGDRIEVTTIRFGPKKPSNQKAKPQAPAEKPAAAK